jgi:NADPH:quinone reductase
MSKAIRIEKTGGPEVMQWVDVEVGEPGEGQIRLKQTACGLNYIDVYFRTGLYPQPLPAGLGSEAAGEVSAVGPGVSGLKVGDRVAYVARPPGAEHGVPRDGGCVCRCLRNRHARGLV